VTDTATSGTADDLTRLLKLTERGLDVTQEMLALMRACEREILELVRRNRELELLARSDALTGLPNRRGLEEELSREEARARRYDTPAAVALLDVRGLKSVNDHHGHAAGDALLRTVGLALRASARESDVVARYGGDEFVALLPGAQRDGAEVFLERVRKVANAARLPNGVTIPVTLAAGVATRGEAGTLAAALELADQRLLSAKTHSPS
jgi:diguanylate cyclase (GGDEF)-like protein